MVLNLYFYIQSIEEEPQNEQIFCEMCEKCAHQSCIGTSAMETFICDNCLLIDICTPTENQEQQEEKNDQTQNATASVSNAHSQSGFDELYSQLSLVGFEEDVLTGASLNEYLSCEVNKLHHMQHQADTDDNQWLDIGRSVSLSAASEHQPAKKKRRKRTVVSLSPSPDQQQVPDEISESTSGKKQSVCVNDDEEFEANDETSDATISKTKPSKPTRKKLPRKRKGCWPEVDECDIDDQAWFDMVKHSLWKRKNKRKKLNK